MRQNKDLSSFMRDDALDCICPDGTREKMDAGSMERMKFIGITGGVGAGKSEILHYLETKDDNTFEIKVKEWTEEEDIDDKDLIYETPETGPLMTELEYYGLKDLLDRGYGRSVDAVIENL